MMRYMYLSFTVGCIFLIELGLSHNQRPAVCFVCDSYYDLGCAAPFDNRTYPLIRCPPNHNKCSVTLRKELIDGCMTDRYIRSCAMTGGISSRTSCLMTATGREGEMTCYCDHRGGCNDKHEL